MILRSLLLAVSLAACAAPAAVCEHSAVPAVSIRLLLPAGLGAEPTVEGELPPGLLEIDVAPAPLTHAEVPTEDEGLATWVWGVISLAAIAAGGFALWWVFGSSGRPPQPRGGPAPPRP